MKRIGHRRRQRSPDRGNIRQNSTTNGSQAYRVHPFPAPEGCDYLKVEGPPALAQDGHYTAAWPLGQSDPDRVGPVREYSAGNRLDQPGFL